MFRDYLEQQPEFQAIPQQGRRLAINCFYTGLLCAAKWCLGSTGPDNLKSRVRTAFEEVEDFAYGAFRKQAQELVQKFGLANARQRLRAIALDKDMTPEEASICFGIDLGAFDNVEEMVNLTRALRNRGVDFKIEINQPGTPQDPNTYRVEERSGVPAEVLSTIFGGAPVVDKRPKNAEPKCGSDALEEKIADLAREEVEGILADEERDADDDFFSQLIAEGKKHPNRTYEQFMGRVDRKTPQAYTDRPQTQSDRSGKNS